MMKKANPSSPLEKRKLIQKLGNLSTLFGCQYARYTPRSANELVPGSVQLFIFIKRFSTSRVLLSAVIESQVLFLVPTNQLTVKCTC